MSAMPLPIRRWTLQAAAAGVLLAAALAWITPSTLRADETTPTVSASSDGTTVTAVRSGGGVVYVAKLEDQSINPVTARFVVDSIATAESNGSPIVILLDTPGGMVQSTREILKAIHGSTVPVITFVAPNGSRAASAGMFITVASHVAAMAPVTNIGAAHPVGIGGKWPTKPKDDSTTTVSEAPPLFGPAEEIARRTASDSPDSGEGDIMSEKVMNDILAMTEAIAKYRNRNVEWTRDAVTKSVSVTAERALELNVIDVIADDIPSLLKAIDGRVVKVAKGEEYRLQTAGASVRELELSTRQAILNVLADPNIAFLLLLIGVAGLLYEITNPGLLIPGVVGAICLLLAAFALNMLPTNYIAIILMLVGIAMLIMELKFTSYGLLTLGGALCLLVGSLALFEKQPQGFFALSGYIVYPAVLTIVAITSLMLGLVVRTQRLRPAIGGNAHVGQTAEVVRALAPEGKVFFDGTLWDAESKAPVEEGKRVRIVGRDRLKLKVEPID